MYFGKPTLWSQILKSTDFLPVHESHSYALSRDIKHLRLYGQVCFYRWLFPMLSNYEDAFYGLCAP